MDSIKKMSFSHMFFSSFKFPDLKKKKKKTLIPDPRQSDSLEGKIPEVYLVVR